MSIKQFEIFHGIVLAKLLRSKKPVSLRMIETRPISEDWRIYTFNIDYDLFVKHRASSHKLKNGNSWQFNFSPSEVSRILIKDRPVYVALVCGQANIQEQMEICFLKPEQVKKIFPSDSSKTFSFTVKSVPRKELKVGAVKVPRDAIEKWDIPGS